MNLRTHNVRMMGKLADSRTRKSIGELPGGGMFELGCHMIDAVVTLLGKPGKVIPFSTPTQPADGVKDNQLAVLEYAKATVTLRCNHADPFGGPRRRFQVTGTKGSIEIMPMESGELVARFTEAHAPYKKGEQKVKLEVENVAPTAKDPETRAGYRLSTGNAVEQTDHLL